MSIEAFSSDVFRVMSHLKEKMVDIAACSWYVLRSSVMIRGRLQIVIK